jgi:sugar phosphate isomerase/epimerase
MKIGGHVKTPGDIEFLVKHGFDFGEVVFSKAGDFAWAREIPENASNPDFFLIGHGPKEGPPRDLDRLWNGYFGDVIRTLDVAHGLGITLLTIHLWVDSRFIPAPVIDEKKRFLKRVVDYAGQRNIVIALENLSERAYDLTGILRAVKGLGVTLDVGHAQLLSSVNRSFEILQRLGDSVRHVHIHDNRGGQGVDDDLHLPLGDGIIDFQAILKTLIKIGYKGTLTLELEQGDLLASRDKLAHMIDAASEGRN